ncbi:hypothetical protein [Streptomyces sp. YGL11-2]|uniref:hypothetical protein n=1 Tax=Streptomyces sp. YGL11-2 TaxID=3414028 RepID=UPI003CF64405
MPNEIIRHPRLSSDAVRLLTWQLSLPDNADEPLSQTARRAGIKKTPFIRAKRQLSDEGYLHEWRRQGSGGRWSTTQLVSNVPLSATEASAVPDDRPTGLIPAVGEPESRAVGRSHENTEEKTSTPPSPATSHDTALDATSKRREGGRPNSNDHRVEPEPQSARAVPQPLLDRAVQALASVSHEERRLRLGGQEVKNLAPLAAEWFERGATVADVRDALTVGLPQHVHCAAALVRDRLTRKMPEAPSLAAQREREATSQPRLARMRECTGEHIQPLLFRPVADESLCPSCRHSHAEDSPAGPIQGTGRQMFTAARAAMAAVS